MNKTMRVLTMAGMGILAGLTIGAGPAQASDAGTGSAAKAAPSKAAHVQQFHGRDRVVGYYRSLRACERAGRIGELRDRWDDYDCDYVRYGFRRGVWALEVSRHWGFNNGRGPWDHGPFGPNFVQHFGPNRGPLFNQNGR